MGGVSEFDLPNGLKILLVPDQYKTTTSLNIAYNVGSLQEDYGGTGSAHLLEHMMFKGTPNLPDLVGALRDRGINFNASTDKTRTNYVTTFVADAEKLDWVIGMEADRMVNAKVDRRDLDSEMTVVRNELEIGENRPNYLFLYRLNATAYHWHNYGKATIGARSDVENVPIDRLRTFYRSWYRPDNATLIVSGKFDPQKTLAQIAQRFGAIKRPATPLIREYTVEPAQDGERRIVIRRPGAQPTIGLAYHTPAATHPDNVALVMLSRILSQQPGGRLYQTLVQPGLATSASLSVDSNNDPGLATVIASPQAGTKPETLEADLATQMEHLSDKPFTDTEVAQAKQFYRNAIEASRDDVDGLAQQLVEATGLDWRMVFRQRVDLMKVTAADVNRVAATYFKATNRSTALFLPTEKPELVTIGQAPDSIELVRDFTGPAPVPPGETLGGSLAAIEARTTTVALGDGLKIAMLPKKTRGNRVTAMLNFHFGDAASLTGKVDVSGLAGALLMAGSGTMNREQIKKKIDDLGGSISVSGNLQNLVIVIDVGKDQLVEALRVAAGLLRNPTYPQSEFNEKRSQWMTILEGQLSDRSRLFGEAISKHFDTWPIGHPEHYRSVQERLASLKAVTNDDVRQFQKTYYGTSIGEGVVIGEFDPEQIKAEMDSLFAHWKSPFPYTRMVARYRPISPVQDNIEIPGRPNSDFQARSDFAIDPGTRDRVALTAASNIFGGGMASRLGARIRGKEGLSYSVGAAIKTPDEGDRGVFTIAATTPPQNVAKLARGVREELERFVRDGATKEEVGVLRASMLDGVRNSHSSDGQIASLLMSNLTLGRSMSYQRDLEKWIDELSVEQVNAALRRYIRPEAMSVFVGGDFAATPPASVASAPN